MKNYKELKEAIRISQVQVGPPNPDGSLEYNDLNTSNLGDPRVITIFNTYLATLDRCLATDLETILRRIRMKLGIFNLNFDYGDIFRSMEWKSSTSILIPVTYFGGIFDPYTGEHLTGLEKWYPDGLYLCLYASGKPESGGHIYVTIRLVRGEDIDFTKYEPHQYPANKPSPKSYADIKSLIQY